MLYFSRRKTILIWLVVLFSMAVAALNFLGDRQLSALPQWFPARSVALGLDLQGGTLMMLKIERADIVRERLEATVADVRATLRQAAIRYSGLSGVGQTIQVRITDPDRVQAAVTALSALTEGSGDDADGAARTVMLHVGEQGQMTLQITDAAINDRISAALVQSMDVVRRRVQEMGNGEPRVQRQGADRIIVQVPGLTDPERLKDLLNEPASLTFRMIDRSMSAQQALDGRAPAGFQVLYSQDDPPVPYLVARQAFVSGGEIADAQASFDKQTNEPVVAFVLDADGTENLAAATRQRVGDSFAVVLDDQVISTILIREPILGGTGEISGNFSDEGVEDLAVLLRAGALPAALTVVEERTVGPSMGSDSIRSGLVAGVIAAVLVAGFMLAAYGFLGLIANVALAANLIMIIAVLTLLGSSLTLPGIAGIVLTLGMAVDSNVLIYERIRDEVRSGRSLAQAADIGFAKGLVTIIDANVTTFIAAIILLYVGSGPVRGFALALAVGIPTTLFTAFTLTRWIMARWLEWRHPKALPRGVHTGILDGTNIRFMGIRRYTFTVSAALSIVAMAAFATVGLNRGVDFTGGSIIEIEARQGDADLADIRARVDSLNLGEVELQGLGDGSGALIRVQSQQGGENAEQSATTLIRGELGQDYDIRRVEAVGPAVSGELTLSATLGIAASLAVILIYIWFRFEWQFAIGAITATLHDIILTLGLFVLTGIEFNLTSIAALLTIVGYSLNDTVVVYDRMRENLRRYEKMPLPILIDASINQTLSRTLLTAATTLLALVALFLFGGEVIRSFAFILIFGVAIGTFSSIYIAAPVLIAFRLRAKGLEAEDDADGASFGGDLHHGKPVV